MGITFKISQKSKVMTFKKCVKFKGTVINFYFLVTIDFSHAYPCFKKAQGHESGGDLYRGGDGPLVVSNGPMENPLFRAF